MNAPAFARALAAWFDGGSRDLPWRRTRDPYRIWLSEIMLQQTRVETVLPYYARFLERWPTVEALAGAEQGDVLKTWEGLGYYARCRNLHRAAQQIVATHGGRLPDSLDGWLALPGVGRSTAGAILTFGFGQRHPLLDGNVKRVLTRLWDVAEVVTRAPVERRLWAWSAELLNAAGDPWTHNQAMMELGARVCAPREPACGACPGADHCAARAAGSQGQRPVKKPKKPLPHKQIGVAVIGDEQGRILIQLRPPEGLLGGLWEFPGGKQEPGETIEDCVRRETAEELGLDVEVGPLVTRVKHAYSHFRITLHAYRCTVLRGTPTPRVAPEWRWVPLGELTRYAFPKANKTVIEALLADLPA